MNIRHSEVKMSHVSIFILHFEFLFYFNYVFISASQWSHFAPWVYSEILSQAISDRIITTAHNSLCMF